MAQKLNWLRHSGTAGSWLANALVFLTTNWVLAVSVAAGVLVGAVTWLRVIILSPVVLGGWTVFVLALWTLIGLTYLRDRRNPRSVKTHQDYTYGITFEGMSPNYTPTNSPMPDKGGLQFLILIRNFGPGPVKCTLEDVDIRIGSRTIPKYPKNSIAVAMARGAGRQARPIGFTGGTLAEFYGKGTITGTAEFSFCYGPTDGPPIRRLRISLSLWMVFPPSGIVDAQNNLGYADAILSEEDTPI